MLLLGHYINYALDDVFAVEVGLAHGAEFDDAVRDCKESIVLAGLNAHTRKNAAAALAHDNGARLRGLAVIELSSEIFRI